MRLSFQHRLGFSASFAHGAAAEYQFVQEEQGHDEPNSNWLHFPRADQRLAHFLLLLLAGGRQDSAV